MSPVAVLCGGKGTRLGEPIKCLTEVAGRPFMDWKLDQLARMGATDVTLIVGPFERQFARYDLPMIADPQEGVQRALPRLWPWWWTMGDVLLEQEMHDGARDVCFVNRGTQIGGLWLDCGLYHGRGPWQMVETTARPYHINTPDDLAECETYLRGAHANLHRLGSA